MPFTRTVAGRTVITPCILFITDGASPLGPTALNEPISHTPLSESSNSKTTAKFELETSGITTHACTRTELMLRSSSFFPAFSRGGQVKMPAIAGSTYKLYP
jgi:hypothetical protein